MDKLTKDEVLHVANLAKLELNEEEVDKFSYQLKAIMDEIDRINDVDVDTSDILISPWSDDCVLRDDEVVESSKELCDDLINNAPEKFDSYVEVRGVFND